MSKEPKRKRSIKKKTAGHAFEGLLAFEPTEVWSEIEQTKNDAEEVERDVEKTEDSINRGARRTKHRFRL